MGGGLCVSIQFVCRWCPLCAVVGEDPALWRYVYRTSMPSQCSGKTSRNDDAHCFSHACGVDENSRGLVGFFFFFFFSSPYPRVTAVLPFSLAVCVCPSSVIMVIMYYTSLYSVCLIGSYE